MGSCLRQLVVLRGLTATRRKFWLMAASALAPISLGVSEPAVAANECGSLDVTGFVSCAPMCDAPTTMRNLRRQGAAAHIDHLDELSDPAIKAACTESIGPRCLFRRWRASARPKRAQWKSRALLAILLIAHLALAAASGANAQPVLTSGSNFNGTLISPPFTEIQGNNTITGAVMVSASGNLIIDSRLGTPGPIVITGPGFPVVVQSQGPAGGWPGGPPATLTLTGANVIFGRSSNAGVL